MKASIAHASMTAQAGAASDGTRPAIAADGKAAAAEDQSSRREGTIIAAALPQGMPSGLSGRAKLAGNRTTCAVGISTPLFFSALFLSRLAKNRTTCAV